MAAAMTVFFEVLPDESPVLSSDPCVDDGSMLEDVIAGKRVAAAAVMAIRYQPWLFLASTERQEHTTRCGYNRSRKRSDAGCEV
jgi:hypothetical protein